MFKNSKKVSFFFFFKQIYNGLKVFSKMLIGSIKQSSCYTEFIEILNMQ